MGYGETLTFTLTIPKKQAIKFANKFDPLHMNGNRVLPNDAVSGLLVVSLINKEMTTSQGWRGLLCASSISMEFRKPIVFNEEHQVTVHAYDFPYATYLPGESKRWTARRESVVHVNRCDQLLAVFKFSQHMEKTND